MVQSRWDNGLIQFLSLIFKPHSWNWRFFFFSLCGVIHFEQLNCAVKNNLEHDGIRVTWRTIKGGWKAFFGCINSIPLVAPFQQVHCSALHLHHLFVCTYRSCLHMIKTRRLSLKEPLKLYFSTCLPSVIFQKNVTSNFLLVPSYRHQELPRNQHCVTFSPVQKAAYTHYMQCLPQTSIGRT